MCDIFHIFGKLLRGYWLPDFEGIITACFHMKMIPEIPLVNAQFNIVSGGIKEDWFTDLYKSKGFFIENILIKVNIFLIG